MIEVIKYQNIKILTKYGWRREGRGGAMRTQKHFGGLPKPQLKQAQAPLQS